MAKPRTPSQKKRYAALNKRLAKYVALVQGIYDTLGMEAASIVTTLTNYDGEQPFRFKDYPLTKSRVNELMRYFSHDLQALIYAGTTSEWEQSNLVQDLLANDVLKVYGMRRDGEKVKRYYQPNNDALKAFQRRKDKGMTISQKVWNQHYNFKQELEYAIGAAIEKGQSAVTLSKRISKYLHDFPSLQAEYKERYGTAVDCKDCEYRSIRLARSEINMAYREAEQTRWQQMDFIKGYEIKLSNSHPKFDVCDELASVYPKWFKWLGWHPACMCICIPIVMTDDEWYSGKGKEITDLPSNFVDWVGDNKDRIEKAQDRGTLPYWLKDNPSIYKGSNSLLSQETKRRESFSSIRTSENIDGNTTSEEVGQFVNKSREEIVKELIGLSKNYTHEEAYVILEDGRVYYKKGGTKEVDFNKEEKAMFKGGYLLHNHHYETFTSHDIAFLNTHKLSSIEAVTDSVIYRVTAPKGYRRYSYDFVAEDLIKRARSNVDKRIAKMNSIDADKALINLQSLEIAELCRLLHFRYEIVPNAK